MPLEPLEVVVAGDSTGRIMAEGLAEIAATDLEVTALTRNGCGLLTEGALLDPISGSFRDVPDECVVQIEQIVPGAIRALADRSPAVVVLMVTSWDVSVRRWADGTETVPTDPEHADRLVEGYRALTDMLLDAGAAQVHWVLPPTPNGFWTGRGEGQDDDAWQETSRRAFRTLAATDDRVRVRDLVGWMAAEGVLDSPQFRPDGIHLAPDAAIEVGRWLRDELLAERLLG